MIIIFCGTHFAVSSCANTKQICLLKTHQRSFSSGDGGGGEVSALPEKLHGSNHRKIHRFKCNYKLGQRNLQFL